MAVAYADNVTLMQIVKILKFASNLDGNFADVLMHAVNSSVDQMLFVFLKIIDQLVFVLIITMEIRLILKLVANDAPLIIQQNVTQIMTAQTVFNAQLRPTVNDLARIHASWLPAQQMNTVNWTNIQIQYANAKMVLPGIQYHRCVRNHQFPIVQQMNSVIRQQHANQTYWEYCDAHQFAPNSSVRLILCALPKITKVVVSAYQDMRVIQKIVMDALLNVKINVQQVPNVVNQKNVLGIPILECLCVDRHVKMSSVDHKQYA